MSSESPERLVIRSYPWMEWIGGAAFLAGGVLFLRQPGSLLPGIVLSVIGAAVGLVAGRITTLTADRLQGTVTVSKHSLALHSVHEYAFSDIASVGVASTRSSGRSRSVVHRIAMTLQSGEEVPLQSAYSSGYSGKARRAQQLQTFLGLAGTLPTSAWGAAQQLGQRLVQQSFQPVQEGETGGIPWRLETTSQGGLQLTRWVSDAFLYPGHFLLVAQKPPGSGSGLLGGLLGGLAQLLQRQMLGLYGFAPEDAPGFEAARGPEPPVPELDTHYALFTDDPAGAGHLLNLTVVHALQQWAEDHPLRQVQAAGSGLPGQLVVLFSPRRTYLACLGTAPVEELTRMGAEILLALGAEPQA